MSEASIPIGFLDTILALVAGVLFSLVGIIYRRLRKRLDELEENVAELESQCLQIKKDMDVAHSWMFGREEDPTNSGIAAEIEEINERLEQLVDALHDEEDLDFERDDIDD
ncbi:DUF342 domain-containing protein [Natronolimnobius sp. AArcel1]|uniref:DUF342 domain-containing protein n=1 Tax=Natronolimnobius sp. AArcel1 TaxID=1679093 RepID=UPI0013EDD9D4|nr:DUF342 domain-containing protein [Natronolimnobius sp. AArcel1]NGM69200.1 DUF342 domain-containing protein [Natronolimnobius sp. AArcel1]